MVRFPEAEVRLLHLKICMNCNARNAFKAKKCRKCHSSDLRTKSSHRGK